MHTLNNSQLFTCSCEENENAKKNTATLDKVGCSLSSHAPDTHNLPRRFMWFSARANLTNEARTLRRRWKPYFRNKQFLLSNFWLKAKRLLFTRARISVLIRALWFHRFEKEINGIWFICHAPWLPTNNRPKNFQIFFGSHLRLMFTCDKLLWIKEKLWIQIWCQTPPLFCTRTGLALIRPQTPRIQQASWRLDAFKHTRHTGVSYRMDMFELTWNCPIILLHKKTRRWSGGAKWSVFSFECCQKMNPSGGTGGRKILSCFLSSWKSSAELSSDELDASSAEVFASSSFSLTRSTNSAGPMPPTSTTLSSTDMGLVGAEALVSLEVVNLPLLVQSGLNFKFLMSDSTCISLDSGSAKASREYVWTMRSPLSPPVWYPSWRRVKGSNPYLAQKLRHVALQLWMDTLRSFTTSLGACQHLSKPLTRLIWRQRSGTGSTAWIRRWHDYMLGRKPQAKLSPAVQPNTCPAFRCDSDTRGCQGQKPVLESWRPHRLVCGSMSFQESDDRLLVPVHHNVVNMHQVGPSGPCISCKQNCTRENFVPWFSMYQLRM